MIFADVGGTHIRFGTYVRKGKNKHSYENLEKWPVDEFSSFVEALLHYCDQHNLDTFRTLALATAAWPNEKGDWVFSRAGHWPVLPDDIRKAGFDLTYIGNDFKASALGAVLNADQCLVLKKGHVSNEKGTSVVLGPGTGLGIAYVDTPPDLTVRETFGGHMALTAKTFEHIQILKLINRLKSDPHDLRVEHVVSGPGLLLLFEALCHFNGLKVPDDLNNHTFLMHQSHPVFQDTMRLFAEFLGITVQHAVFYGHAFSGVYLDGGAIHKLIEHDCFDQGRFLDTLAPRGVDVVKKAFDDLPVYIVQDPYIALRGLAYLTQND